MTKTSNKPPLKIVVLDRGFVFIGRITEIPEEGRTIIDDCLNIRKWGTTEGLGQLRNGPTTDTVLDKCGTVTIPDHIFMIDCDESKWSAHF